MSDVIDNDELNALAAEYVLGTLDYEERKGAAGLLEVDPTFRGIVRIWERRFGDLHLMVEAVEPDPQLWLRIKPKMAGVVQDAPAIPSSKVPEEPAAAADDSHRVLEAQRPGDVCRGHLTHAMTDDCVRFDAPRTPDRGQRDT